MTAYYTDKGESDIVAFAPTGGVAGQIAQFSVAVALANSDTLTLFHIPKGAKIIDLWVQSDGTQSGNNSTYKVGDSVDDDRFMTTSVGDCLRTGGGRDEAVIGGLGYEYTSDTDIVLTIVEQGAGQTTGGKIKAGVYYVIGDND